MKWFRWVRRAFYGLVLLAAAVVAAWIYWPVPEPAESELVRLVPSGASWVLLHRDLRAHWPSLRQSAFLKAASESSLMPVRIKADSFTERTAEHAILDLFGRRVVVFGTASSICAVAPVTPGSKWLWLRAQLFQRWSKAGFTIRKRSFQGQTVQEVTFRHAPGSHLHFARRGNLLFLSLNDSGEAVAGLLRANHSAEDETFRDLAAARPSATQIGRWTQAEGTATWVVSVTNRDCCRLELTLPKQRTVRLPWDADRGPRSMALVQKLFPDQGIVTLRGRVSHWMGAWDNVIAWLRLSPDFRAETLLAQLKYGERLSHGLFPWSGAGDELAWVVAPPVPDTPAPWPSIIAALRCWETNDTQVAMRQFLPTLSYALGEELRLAPEPGRADTFSVHMGKDMKQALLFMYRYSDGLVLGSNSREYLSRFDPQSYAGQALQPSQPENQLWLKPAQIAPLLQALSVWQRFAGDSRLSGDLNHAASLLAPIEELRLTIRMERETVRYELELTEAKP